jgi:hypothetical protein
MGPESKVSRHSMLFLIVLCGALLCFPRGLTSSPLVGASVFAKFARTSNPRSNQTAPSAIEYFDGYSQRVGIKLLWSVFSEKDVEGFQLYRMADDESYVSVINKRGLLPAWRQNFVDDDLKPATTYRYLLGVVFSDGTESLSQPVDVRSPKETIQWIAAVESREVAK